MHICQLAPVLIQAIEVYQNHPRSTPLGRNLADFFGKNDKKKPEIYSMSQHIRDVTGKPISGSTLLQSMYRPVMEYLQGKSTELQVNIKPETLEILEMYVQKEGEGLLGGQGLASADPRDETDSFPAEIEAYRNTHWYLYSYEEYTVRKTVLNRHEKFFFVRGIGRSLMHIHGDGSVTIDNFDLAGGQRTQNTNYHGRIRIQDRYVIELDLLSEKTQDKHLHIRMIRNHMPLQDLALGGYINKGVKYGILMGSLVFELAGKGDQAELKAPDFFPIASPEFQTLDPSIIRYLRKRKYSYMRVPVGIPDHIELLKWLESEKADSQAYPDRYENYDWDLFIAAPFSSLPEPIRDELTSRFRDINQSLQEAHGFSRIGSGSLGSKDSGVLWNANVIKGRDPIDIMKNSRYFMLIFPSPVISSALIQTGIALGLKKPTVIFYRQLEDLPQIIQKAAHVRSLNNVRLIPYRDYDEIISIIRETQDLFIW